MSKVYLTDGIVSSSWYTLIGEGRSISFGLGGNFIEEREFAYTNLTLREVDILSLLVWNRGLEVALNIDGYFSIVESASRKSQTYLVSELNKMNGLIFIGNRPFKDNGVDLMQYLYTFRPNTLGSSLGVLL